MADVIDTVPVREWLFRIRDYAVHSRFIGEDYLLHLIDGLESALSKAYPDGGFDAAGGKDIVPSDGVVGEDEEVVDVGPVK